MARFSPDVAEPDIAKALRRRSTRIVESLFMMVLVVVMSRERVHIRRLVVYATSMKIRIPQARRRETNHCDDARHLPR
jgi:hypothetical protein